MSKDSEAWFDVGRDKGPAPTPKKGRKSSPKSTPIDPELLGKITLVRDYLNNVKTRCTYNAAAEALGVTPQMLKKAIGERSPETSWFVNMSSGEPTGYADNEKHPELYRTDRIIKSAEVLKRNLEL